MTDQFGIQISFKFGPANRHGEPGDMVNVRANTEAELTDRLAIVSRQFAAIAQTGADLRTSVNPAPGAAEAAVVQQFPQAQPVQPVPAAQNPAHNWVGPQQQTQVNQQAGAPANQEFCNHGAMKYLQAKRGRNAGGYFWACPADRNDPSKCSPRNA